MDRGYPKELSLQLLEEAGIELVSWEKDFACDVPLTLSVNLSNRQFSQSDLVEKAKRSSRDMIPFMSKLMNSGKSGGGGGSLNAQWILRRQSPGIE